MIVRTQQQVRPEWVDYNGHLSEAYYVLVFGFATDAVMDAVGLHADYRARTGASLFTSEAHIRYLAQVEEGETVEVRSCVIGAAEKVLWLWHELVVADSLRATEEVLGVHVDVASGTATALPRQVLDTVQAMLRPVPPAAGRHIGVGGRRG